MAQAGNSGYRVFNSSLVLPGFLEKLLYFLCDPLILQATEGTSDSEKQSFHSSLGSAPFPAVKQTSSAQAV